MTDRGTALVPTVVYPDAKVSYFGEWIDDQNQRAQCVPTTFEAAQAWLVEEVKRHLAEWGGRVGQGHRYRYREALGFVENAYQATQWKVNWHTLQIVPFVPNA